MTSTSSVVTTNAAPEITLDFSVINHSTDCEKKSTTARFKVAAVASSTATFKARFMGKAVELNLSEAAPGETPEEFELFTKG